MKLIQFVILAISLSLVAADQCNIGDYDRIDCGFYGIKEDQCHQQGCCWSPASFLSKSTDTPWCFRKANDPFCKKFNLKADHPGFDGSYDTMYQNYLANLNIGDKGGVVASPDPDTPGGSYYYHWMRDAALSMKTYMILNDFKIENIQNVMNKYVNWVKNAQNAFDPHNQSVLNEPKFYLPDGGVINEAWCRPQTDGPGLRATTLMQYAQALINNGQEDFVNNELWRLDGQGLIQKDLDYVANNWQEYGCDLWEEIRSDDFVWNKMAFHQALFIGAQFAKSHNDHQRYNHYTKVAKFELLPSIKSHWNGRFITESSNRPEDSAVIHALVTLNEGIFDISGQEAAGTVRTLNRLFCTEYKINQDQDSQGIPGILYGRYKNDEYAGGNPWQLLTATLAELFYQNAEKFTNQRDRFLKPNEVDHWRDILDITGDQTAHGLGKVFRKAGNAVMYRIWTHVSSGYEGLTEQMDRNTGFQISAKKLTWSFANVLRVLHSHVYNVKPTQYESILE